MPDDPIAPVPSPDNDSPSLSAKPDEDATMVAGEAPPSAHAGERPAEAVLIGEPAATAFPGKISDVVIGRYKLLNELGKGGFGMVWQAEQTEPIHRAVALKI